MGKNNNTIQYIFLHLDGVILENILVPITYSLINKLGGVYSAEIENNIFAKSQLNASKFLIDHLNLSCPVEEVIQLYYTERKKYESENQIKINEGLENLLNLLKSLDYKIISYGGASKEYFYNHMSDFLAFFNDEKYIQTRDIRPGVREIIQDIYKLNFNQTLFIDEEKNIAEAAKQYNVPFVGMTSKHNYSFQGIEMKKVGVKYIVDSLFAINKNLLERIEIDSLKNCIWLN